MVLNKTADRIVETVREGQWRPSFAARFTRAVAHVSEKFFGRSRRRSFGERGRDEFAAVIVRAAKQNLFPRFAMGRLEIVALREFLDFVRGQRIKKFLRELA